MHGEFGEQFSGFVFTNHAWMQSYGSRVRPLMIYGDVLRPQPMTVSWWRYAESPTDKARRMPAVEVTILNWSLVREDIPRSQTCQQIGLAGRQNIQSFPITGEPTMQYPTNLTNALEFIWGEGILSPGGPEEVAQMLEGIDVSGCRVLDIGSGLGGIDVLLAAKHGASAVIGIDVEPQLIDSARDLAAKEGLSGRVTFQLVTTGKLPFADASFNLVFSKDAMVHITDKLAVYSEVLRVLKPGGWFIAADWLWSESAAESAVVHAWLSKMQLTFAFTPPAAALRALIEAGFAEPKVSDLRRELQEANRKEVALLEGPIRQKLAAIVGTEMAENRLASAKGRQGALDSGDLIPCHLSGRRPT
ncbi:methyltransferase domain-containing protein [Mesorhizobium newzealandense]|uniref:Methyltransferase domain-containing protein n=1 Tax=Mesorhizobium newzealandense TaxID=1300302 RepID=A0ABW4UEV9_9HYPH